MIHCRTTDYLPTDRRRAYNRTSTYIELELPFQAREPENQRVLDLRPSQRTGFGIVAWDLKGWIEETTTIVPIELPAESRIKFIYLHLGRKREPNT